VGALTPIVDLAKCDVLWVNKMFIHHPTWSWNEIHKLISCIITTEVE
jgi:hypothetical protein